MLAVESKGLIGYKRSVKTEKILKLILGIYVLASILRLISLRFHSGLLLFTFIVLQLSIGPLLLYALFRENNLGDKSQKVSNKTTLAIFAGVGLMFLLIAINALH